jgi:hypothetical protein
VVCLLVIAPGVPETHAVAAVFMGFSSALFMFGIIEYIHKDFVKRSFGVL